MSDTNARFARPPCRRRSWRRGLEAGLLLGAGVLSACAAPIQYARPVHEDEARFVKLEARYGYGQASAALRFSHPVGLDRAQWERLLQQIEVIRRAWIIPIGTATGGPVPVFRDDEREYLSTRLTDAFTRARADEWVLFYLSRPRGPGLQEVTSGGFFVEGGSLHLVLGNYRVPLSMPYAAEQIRQDPLRPSGDSYYEFVTGDHQVARTYHDWHLHKPLLDHPVELVTDLQTLLTSPSPPEGSPADPTADLERRFRTLEQLRGIGLITEEEYERKRRELLDAL